MKIIKRITQWLLYCCLSLAALGCIVNITVDKTSYESKNTTETLSTLQVHFIDMGQGDATLIICDGHAMLIDAGKNDTGTALQLYLNKQGVTSLDYIIGTHPDEDHIGGMDVILTKFDCQRVMLSDYEKDTASYEDVKHAIEYKSYKITPPIVGDTYTLGSASFTIIAPNREDYEDVNNGSIGIKLTHGENSFLFTGDAEAEAEADMVSNGIDIEADVLHVGHHGSERSTTAALVEAVKPTYAVISCGKDNTYGHPHARTMKTLKESRVELFRTDLQGNVIAYSDGQKISWNCEATSNWQNGTMLAFKTILESTPEQASQPDTATGADTVKYVLNTNSLKFHYPDCKSVADMKEKNKRKSALSRDEIIAQGYSPCGSCKP